MLKINNTKASQRIKDLIIPLLVKNDSHSQLYKFYAWFSLYIQFEEDNEIPTGGVRVTKQGMEFVYNPEFILSLPDKALCFFWLHEIFHLLNRHNQRLTTQGHKLEAANIAMDAVVNQLIIKHISTNFADFKNSPIENGIFLSKIETDLGKKYDRRLMYEEMYRWLVENAPEGSFYNPHSGQYQKNEGKYGQNGQHPQQFDVHLDDEVPIEVAEQEIDKALNSVRSRGHISAETEKLIGQLRRTKRDYMRAFAVAASGMNGNSIENTYRRPNKKMEGLKGKKSGGSEIAVILDTSGSMSNDFTQAISQIFRHGYTIQFIQCDTKVKSHKKITSPHQFKTIKLKGFGGTELQPAIDYIRGNKILNKLNLIILTDGYTDRLNLMGIKKTLILTVDKECPIEGGNVKQIVIEK